MTAMTALAIFAWLAFIACCAAILLGDEWSRITAWQRTQRRRADAEDRASAAAWDAAHGEAKFDRHVDQALALSDTPLYDAVLAQQSRERSVEFATAVLADIDALPETDGAA